MAARESISQVASESVGWLREHAHLFMVCAQLKRQREPLWRVACSREDKNNAFAMHSVSLLKHCSFIVELDRFSP